MATRKNAIVPAGGAALATTRLDDAELEAVRSRLAPLLTGLETELARKVAMLDKLEPIIAAIDVNSDATLTDAVSWATDVSRELDQVEAVRTSFTGPLNAILRTVNGWFKPVSSRLEALRKQLDSKTGAYHVAQRAAQTAALQAAADAHRAGDHETAALAVTAANNARTVTPGNATFREVWQAKIVNPSLVPRAWCVPNESAINKHARECPADVAPSPIAGVEFAKVPEVRIRR